MLIGAEGARLLREYGAGGDPTGAKAPRRLPGTPADDRFLSANQQASKPINNGIFSGIFFSGLILQNEIELTGNDGIFTNNRILSMIENNIAKSEGNHKHYFISISFTYSNNKVSKKITQKAVIQGLLCYPGLNLYFKIYI
jgi:hypothetical protein